MHIVRRSALALGALAALLLLIVPGVHAFSSTGRPSCLVSNDRTGTGAPTLQQAIDAAAPGDTLVVKGRCLGASVVDRDLTLKGVSNKAFGVATLDGRGFGGSVLTARGVAALTIRNLTVTGGEAGGILADSALTLRLTGTTVTDNADFGVSGLHFGGSATVTDSTVSHNDGPGIDGGGAWTITQSTLADNAGTGLVGVSQSAVLTNATVEGNGAGGISNFAGTLRIASSSVTGNDGSGIHLFDAPLLLTESTVSGNAASGSGGGIDSEVNSLAVIRDSTVSGNTAVGNGGGINVASSFLVVDDSTISGNTAGGNGGGVHLAGGIGFQATIADSTVSGNGATSGGGIFVDPLSMMSVTLAGANAFAGNTPDDCVGVPGC